MSPITTHVLDTARGRPAEGVPITLEVRDEHGSFSLLGQGTTDSDGRLKTLVSDASVLRAGVYRITFDTAAYFATRGEAAFFPSVPIVFEIKDTKQHYHVPLLLSPFGYSTYRGS
jgi:5-hydroxyisourate hydrolase